MTATRRLAAILAADVASAFVGSSYARWTCRESRPTPHR
jgi:hypothetical protein